MLLCLVLMTVSGTVVGQIERADPAGDAVIRRTNPGANGPIDPINHRLPDVISYRIGNWQPSDPTVDLFNGAWTPSGAFFRLDLVLSGCMNPPGTVGPGFPFDPFKYGPNPLFGYLEIDMDADTSTGGDLSTPEQTFLGNTSRFGGLPALPYDLGRVALDASAFDHNINTPPFVDRSGEEFHLAFHGWQITNIVKSNPSHSTFVAGDQWIVSGNLFHRAHGYERFSYACCQGSPGSYEPIVQVQFLHDPASDRTTVTLVYPLTNAASAAMLGSSTVESLDGDVANQNSVLEALDDLVFSVDNASQGWLQDQNFPIISNWGNKDAASFLNSELWRINVLLATSYTAPASGGATFVWTDVAPDARPGDLNGDGQVNAQDVSAFDAFLTSHDGTGGFDSDGPGNGRITLISFGPNFSLYDVNYDGVIDANDRAFIVLHETARADFDRDGDVDMDDFGHLQTCMNAPVFTPICQDADLDGSGGVNNSDFNVFQLCARGAGVSADVGCAP